MAKLSNDEINFVLNLNAAGLQKELLKSSAEIKKFETANKALKQEIRDVEKFMKSTATAMQKLEKAGKTNSEEYKELKNTYASAADELASYTLKVKENNDAIDSNIEKQNQTLSSMKNSEMTMTQLRKKAADLQKQLNNTSQAADPATYSKLQKELTDVNSAMGNLKVSGNSVSGIFTQMPGPLGTATASVQGLGTAFKALLGAGPLGVVILILTAVIALFTALKKAIGSSEESVNKFNQILAPLNLLLDKALAAVQMLVNFILDKAIKAFSWLADTISKVIPSMDKYIQKGKEAVVLEREKQQLAKDERALIVSNAETQLKVSTLRANAQMKDKYSAEERLEMINQALDLEEQQMIATEKLRLEKRRIEETEAARAENTAQTNERLAQLQAEALQAETEFNNKSMELLEKRNSFAAEIAAEQKAAADAFIAQQKKDIEDMTAAMEEEQRKRLALIDQENSQQVELEASKNLRVLYAQKEFSENIISQLKDRLAKVKDEELKADINSGIIAREEELLSTIKEIDQERINLANQGYSEQLSALESAYTIQKQTLDQRLASMKLSQEEYQVAILFLEEQQSAKKLELARQANQELVDLEVSSGALKAAAVKESGDAVIAAEMENAARRIEVQRAAETALMDFKIDYNLLTEQELQKAQLASLEATYKVRREMMQAEGLSTLELDAAYEQAKTNMQLSFEQQRFSLRQQLGVENWNEEYELKISQLKAMLESEAITQDEFEDAIENERLKRIFEFYNKYASLVTNAVQSMQQAEIDMVDAKYDAEIAAAGDNAEEVARLEQEKAQKKLDIEKKYADVNFAIQVAEIISSTAVAIMQSFAQLGPIAGAVAAALMGATGAAQIVSANAQRQKVKSMTLSSSSSSTGERVVTGYEDGGYTNVTRAQDGKQFSARKRGSRRGYFSSPSILVSENGAEFVASAATVNNPTVRPILDIIDSAQQKGVSGRLNFSSMLINGYQDGGYTGSTTALPTTQQQASTVLMTDESLLIEIKDLLTDLKKNGVKAPIVLSDLQKKIELQASSNNYASKN